MKKLIYLFAAVIMFAFTACGGADTATEQAAPAAEEVVAEEAVAEEAVAEEAVAEEAVVEEEATEEAAE